MNLDDKFFKIAFSNFSINKVPFYFTEVETKIFLLKVVYLIPSFKIQKTQNRMTNISSGMSAIFPSRVSYI